MYVKEREFKTKSGKVFKSILLSESYREGKKVKTRTVANISKCSQQEVEAIKIALKHKSNLCDLKSIKEIQIHEKRSFGSIWAVYQIAKRLHLESVLGLGKEGKLALWQIISRVVLHGSRLATIRMTETYDILSMLNIDPKHTVNDLYNNLHWLADNQKSIEKKLFKKRYRSKSCRLLLYDVTSSYLEGDKNALADFGYNRDGKRGKKQIVIGLLCDEKGFPISVEVFRGNTNDTKTFSSQIKKAATGFGCNDITFVGDRGMIKNAQIDELIAAGFHYITAITKQQINTLVKNDTIQMELFDKDVMEVEEDGVRYLFRKNPVREKEIQEVRRKKIESLQKMIQLKNEYLKNHAKAKPKTHINLVEKKINQLQVGSWASVSECERKLTLKIDKEAKEEEGKLDGCYVIRTDLPSSVLDKDSTHQRYKDLAFVETAFRNCKTLLDLRPIFVQSEKSTCGHVFVVMLSYMIQRELREAWKDLEATVDEGLQSLSTLNVVEVSVKGSKSFHQLPVPREQNEKLLEALKIKMPFIVAKGDKNVGTTVHYS